MHSTCGQLPAGNFPHRGPVVARYPGHLGSVAHGLPVTLPSGVVCPAGLQGSFCPNCPRAISGLQTGRSLKCRNFAAICPQPISGAWHRSWSGAKGTCGQALLGNLW